MTLEEIQALPGAFLHQKPLPLPQGGAVYVALSSDRQEVLYVGATQSLARRGNNHELKRGLKRRGVWLAWWLSEDSGERKRVERGLIDRYEPQFNKQVAAPDSELELSPSRRGIRPGVRIERGLMQQVLAECATEFPRLKVGKVTEEAYELWLEQRRQRKFVPPVSEVHAQERERFIF